MNLLRIIASMDPVQGGPCQGIRNSLPELERLGVHNEVVCLDAPDAKFLVKDLFQVHALGPVNNAWAYSSKLDYWLMENLCRFDVVIVHGLWLYPGYAVRKAIKRLNAGTSASEWKKNKIPKVFIMPHGMLDPYFQNAPGRKLKAIRNWIYFKLIERKVLKEADGLLFTCEEELQLARLPFDPYTPKKEINVGYGIVEPPGYNQSLINAFYKIVPGLKGRPYLLFLSRIHRKKGVDLLINAYAKIIKVQASDPQTPALVIAGPGMDTGYGKELLQLANSFPELNDLIHFPGMLTGEEKWGAFYGCEAFILPSHQENFGIAIVEALACGKPVLISDRVNIWREIKASGSGFVSTDTLEGVKGLLESWLSIPISERKDMGARAEELYTKRFSIKNAAKNVFEFLEKEVNTPFVSQNHRR